VDGDSKAIIKKKYYKLAMKFHPDKHHDESSDKMKEATQILQLLNDCYEMVG
jgi:DnaJ-class molecular chaperone